ncbi:MAG: GNAT family N-acetyltransferase [Allosphingosinicella sp.]
MESATLPGAAIDLRRLRRAETDAAARIHRLGIMTIPGFDGRLHTAEDDRAYYRDCVFAECEILGAFDGDTLLGYLAWSPGWIDHLYVDPAHHGHGIGGQLLERVQSRVDDIQLWTFQVNRGARRFYERHDFLAEEFTDGRDNDEQTPDVRYRWRRPDRPEPS